MSRRRSSCRPQQKLLKCQEVQIKLRLPTSTSTLFTLSSVCSGCLCSVRADFSLGRRKLSMPRDLVTVFSLMRSLSSTTSCLRNLGEPIDLKSPRAETLMFSPLVQLLVYALVVHKSSSNYVTPISPAHNVCEVGALVCLVRRCVETRSHFQKHGSILFHSFGGSAR